MYGKVGRSKLTRGKGSLAEILVSGSNGLGFLNNAGNAGVISGDISLRYYSRSVREAVSSFGSGGVLWLAGFWKSRLETWRWGEPSPWPFAFGSESRSTVQDLAVAGDDGP